MHRNVLARGRQSLEGWLEPTRFLAAALTLIAFIILLIFIRLHDENLAWGDELRNLEMILAIRQGRFELRYLFASAGGHYTVPTFATMALLAALTSWNIKAGIVVSVGLAWVMLILFTRVFAADRPGTWAYVLPAFAALIFSVHQDLNWMGPYVGHWFWSLSLFAGALVMLVRFPDSWRGVGLAALCAFGATFSSGNGLLSWLVLVPVMIGWGFRKRGYYAAWAVAALISIALFASGLTAEGAGYSQSGVLQRLPTLIQFVLSFLGAVFISRANLPGAMGLLSAAIGAAGIGLMAINGALLWRSERRMVLTWIAVAGYAVLSGVVIGLRLNATDLSRAYIAWYATFTNLFWIALIALAYAVIERGWRAETTSSPRLAALGNIGALVGLLMLHLIQNNRISETSYVGDDPRFHTAGSHITEACGARYIETLDGGCLKEWLPTTTIIASHRMNMFADRQAVSIMPEGYAAGEPILIETASGWHSAVIRDWWLAGIDAADTFFVYTSDPQVEAQLFLIREPLGNMASELNEADRARVEAFITEGAVFWLVRPASVNSRIDEWLNQTGYAADAPILIEPNGFVITRYVRGE